MSLNVLSWLDCSVCCCFLCDFFFLKKKSVYHIFDWLPLPLLAFCAQSSLFMGPGTLQKIMAHLGTCKRLFSGINLVYSTQKTAAFSSDLPHSSPLLRRFLLVCSRKYGSPIAIPSSVSTQFPWQCALFIAPTDVWARTHTLARVWVARAGVWYAGASRDAIKQPE